MTHISSKSPVKPSMKPTIIERLMWICNTIFHQLVAIVGTFILWTLFYNSFNKNSLASWHMVLSTIAYVPLMAEAIVLFSDDNVWTQKIPRITKYYIHGIILFTSAVLATIGISFMISVHSNPHFYSTHAWTGLVSWIFVLLSQFLGLASANAQKLKGIVKPVWFKFTHNFFGILGYLFGLTSLCYGLERHSIKLYTTEEARLLMMVLTGIIGAWTIVAALKSGYSQLKSILNSY